MMLKIRVAVLIYFGVWLNKETGVPQMPTLCFLQIKTKMYKKIKKNGCLIPMIIKPTLLWESLLVCRLIFQFR